MSRFNISNLNRYAINCASYALEIKDWLNFPDEVVFNKERDINKRLQMYIDIILKLPFVRQINSIDDLDKDEYAIAFKCGFSDFHFIKRCNNGVWKEKCGGCPTIFKCDKDRVFSKVWLSHEGCTIYLSETVLFAVKKNRSQNEEVYVVCQRQAYRNYFIVEDIFNDIKEAQRYELKMMARYPFQDFLVETRSY